MQEPIPTGSRALDQLLNGGYERGIITTIYGPAGSGKTTLCILCSVLTAKYHGKVIYIDTEGGFSVERFKQICTSIKQNHKKLLDECLFLKPTNFEEQKQSFQKLKEAINDKIALIIIDSIAMLYRLELGKSESPLDVNRELARQIGILTEIARNNNCAILVTNQVYTDFDDREKINLVGGDVLKYGSKCLLELQITPSNNRRVIIKKHRSLPSEQERTFKIVEGGIIGTKESKGFKLFSK